MNHCKNCGKPIIGREGKKYCDTYCKSAYQYQQKKVKEPLYFKIDKQLKKNRSILNFFNKAGKAYVPKSDLIDKGFDPKYFTHYWKNTKGQVYLFCYEFGFLEISDKGKSKFLLVQWQEYMD